ncbi:Lipopolysaccharide heptosyltransferase II [Rhodopseudomonas palustris HaA2]|uniref:lipopolysaccharide heptosyltransferase II n=1 Tax=Rhodopseudomonas palustris (strain HaA2) TaxID=316058 RepID=Q2IZP9_RHOP2|nr:lipopolysaccharide heptosyltransferase II [Rhodopseudomonas palustris]ABD06311.1 Lipopolysaccharide heptosyltransferase II [Rhodopseudomonas palustris HaA2]
MNYDSLKMSLAVAADRAETSPVLLIPYMWIGDFVRCHTVVRVLKDRWPDRPVDVLTTTLCAPLVDYMPGVRRGVVWDLPRKRLALDQQRALAAKLREQHYGASLVMPRTFKSTIAPFLAGIPNRTGFIGEVRFGLLNDWRRGEKALPRMIDRCAALALPAGIDLPMDWPEPQLVVPPAEIAAWRRANGLEGRTAVALAPGAVGPSKRWTYYAEAAKALTDRGLDVWVIGGPGESEKAAEIVAAAGPRARDLTGTDLRNGIMALAAADLVISNDSGLLHVAAAIGSRTIGIFGPTSAWHYAPLNPIEAVIETRTDVPCRPCHKPVCRMVHHKCMRDIPVEDVMAAAQQALGKAGLAPAR